MKNLSKLASALLATTVAFTCQSYADTYIVTSTGDGSGSEAPINTLRGALLASQNSDSPKDVILFDLKDPTIHLTKGSSSSDHQIVVNPKRAGKKIIIDGFSQKKGKVPPVILDAGGGATAIGFYAGKVTFQGFQVVNFKAFGVYLDAGAKTTLEKNYIGFSKAKSGKITTNNSKFFGAKGVIIYGSNNTVADNVISGVHNGINIGYDPAGSNFGPLQKSNVISGNYIGTYPSGTTRMGNTSDGMFLGAMAQNNLITKNVIAGNDSAGIELLHKTTKFNRILGNFIGTDKKGSKVIGNGDNGVHLAAYASDNTVGGTSKAERNVISGNKLTGVLLSATPAQQGQSMTNKVIGNYIGCDATGSRSLGNQNVGIFPQGGGSIFNEITSNVIGGNLQWGIYAVGCYSNKIVNNRIGIGPNGQHIGNPRGGVVLDGGGNHTLSGNNIEWNGFAGNGGDYAPNGIRQYNGSTGNKLSGNTIINNRVN